MDTFTFQEVLDFINSQPDETPVDFTSAINNLNVGCLMVQFGRHKGYEFRRCSAVGYTYYTGFPCSTVAEMVDENKYLSVCQLFEDKETRICPKTFGELKKFIKTKDFKNRLR